MILGLEEMAYCRLRNPTRKRDEATSPASSCPSYHLNNRSRSYTSSAGFFLTRDSLMARMKRPSVSGLTEFTNTPSINRGR